MDLYQKRRELFFTNLQLLGLIESSQKDYGITIDKNTFACPNKKAYEVVTHFLFTKLQTLHAGNYSIVWPLYEKKQDHEFRKLCYEYLTKIGKDESSSIRFPSISKTLFLAPGGERFYELYSAFSSYVMWKSITKSKKFKPLHRPKLTGKNLKDIKLVLDLETQSSIEKCRVIKKETAMHEEKWALAANDFAHFNKKTKQKVSELDKSVAKEKSTLFALFPDIAALEVEDSCKMDQIYIKTKDQITKVLGLRTQLSNFLSQDEKLWDIMEPILEPDSRRNLVLDGHHFNVEIPQVLKNDCMEKFKKRNIQSLFKDGKLSLQRFFDSGAVSLEYYKGILEKEGYPDFYEIKAVLEHILEGLKACLEKVETTRKHITEQILPKIEDVTNCTSLVESAVNQEEEEFEFLSGANISNVIISLPETTGKVTKCRSKIWKLSPVKGLRIFDCDEKDSTLRDSSIVSDGGLNLKHLNPLERIEQVLKEAQRFKKPASMNTMPSEPEPSIFNEDHSWNENFHMKMADDVKRSADVRACVEGMNQYLVSRNDNDEDDNFNSISSLELAYCDTNGNTGEMEIDKLDCSKRFSKNASEVVSLDFLEPKLLEKSSSDSPSFLGQKAFSFKGISTGTPMPKGFDKNTSQFMKKPSCLLKGANHLDESYKLDSNMSLSSEDEEDINHIKLQLVDF